MTGAAVVEELFSGFGPDEGVAAFVPAVDERADSGDQLFDAAEAAAADGLTRDDREEDLDHVEPAAAGRGEVQLDPGVLGQPRLHVRVLVGGVVVAHHVQLPARVGPGD